MITLWILLMIGSDVLAQKYLGCFKSTRNDRELPSLVSSNASPTTCIEQCRSGYYMFALVRREQCYCDSKCYCGCPVPCDEDTSEACRDPNSIGIYETGQKGPSPPRQVRVYGDEPGSLRITWQPPDIPNGNISSYTIRAEKLTTHSYDPVLPAESQVQGGSSNTTTLGGLQPGTKYNVSVVAVNQGGDSTPGFASGWTLIGPADKPETPKILKKTEQMIEVGLSEGASKNGPVSRYQVVVVRAGTIPPREANSSYPDARKATEMGSGYYVTAEFDAADFQTYKNFRVGDGRMYGGFYNAPLNVEGEMPQIGLVVVSEVGKEIRYSYSDLTTAIVDRFDVSFSSRSDPTVIALWVAITLFAILLAGSIVSYFVLKRRHEKGRVRRLPEQQELTLQGPVYEVDNMAYVPEDVPERANHYQDLKRKVWSIPKNSLTIDAVVIRRGRFGTVHMGAVEIDGVPTTVSIHSISDGLLRASEKRAMLRELDVCIKAGKAKNLAGLVGTCETPDTLFVVLQMPPQTLKNKLLAARSGDNFPADDISSIGVGVASALAHLESYKIVHGYLCARSVGICNDGTAKLMGHGIARHGLEDLKYWRWTAIELFNNEKKHQQGVVWAFGVLLWEMFSMGGTPYADLNGDDVVEEAVRAGTRLPQLRDIPDPFYEVMLSCWQVDREERPTFHELMRLNTLSVCPITTITEPYIPELELN